MVSLHSNKKVTKTTPITTKKFHAHLQPFLFPTPVNHLSALCNVSYVNGMVYNFYLCLISLGMLSGFIHATVLLFIAMLLIFYF